MLYKYGFTPLCFLLRLNSSFKKMPVAMKSILNTNVKCCCKFADIIFQTFFRSNHFNLVQGKYDKNLPKKYEDIYFLKKEEGEIVFDKVCSSIISEIYIYQHFHLFSMLILSYQFLNFVTNSNVSHHLIYFEFISIYNKNDSVGNNHFRKKVIILN